MKNQTNNDRSIIDPAQTIEKLTKKLQTARLKGKDEDDMFDQIT